MEDSNSFRQMQDEMSRFEAEISGAESLGAARPVIGTGTYGAMQQQLERPLMPPQPPSGMMPPFNPMMAQRMLYPPMHPPPPPPNLMVPAQVQRMRPMMPSFSEHMHMTMSEGPGDEVPAFVRAGLPGPQLLPPPPRPQPVVLSAKPQLYKKPEPKEESKKEDLKRKRAVTPPPREKTPPRELPPPVVAPQPPVVSTPYSHTDPVVSKPKKEKKSRKVVRTAGGQTWEDVTLLEWADDDFRLFCGDLGNDVTDELLIRTFGKYASFQKAKVVRDKRTNKSKGFGFVSFKDPGDFIKAMKEMDGRYVGSRPIKLRKSTWRNRSLDIVRKKEKDKAALLAMLTTNT